MINGKHINKKKYRRLIRSVTRSICTLKSKFLLFIIFISTTYTAYFVLVKLSYSDNRLDGYKSIKH